MYWALYNETTLTGPTSWSSVNTESFVERDIASTGFSGGRVVIDGYVGESSAVNLNIDIQTFIVRGFIASLINGTAVILTLVAASTGVAKPIFATLSWDEIF